MDIKATSKQTRDALQLGIYRVINPFVKLLIRMGVTPNTVTTIGFLGNLAAAVVIVIAGYGAARTGTVDWSLVTWAGALIIGFSLFDMLDGRLSATFGAMYDSVLDRYCELATLGGVAYYLIQTGSFAGAVIAFVALTGSIMVSYVRARAEGLGLECKIGFMQRPERVVVTSVATLATGITGQISGYQPGADGFNPDMILVIAMTVIAIFANLTAIARINHCRKLLAGRK